MPFVMTDQTSVTQVMACDTMSQWFNSETGASLCTLSMDGVPLMTSDGMLGSTRASSNALVRNSTTVTPSPSYSRSHGLGR